MPPPGFALRKGTWHAWSNSSGFKTLKLRRIHDLEALLNAALAYDPSLEPFRAPCQKITVFYLVEGYPLIAEVELTEDDIRNSWQQVQRLFEKLRGEIAK